AAKISMITLAALALRTAIRLACSARLYGIVFACGAPVRALYGNALNSAATINAVARYAWARARGVPLKWLKTDHAYPHRAALLDHHRKLGEILAGSGCMTSVAIGAALAARPAGMRIGEYLLATGAIGEGELYDALSLQQGLPVVSCI